MSDDDTPTVKKPKVVKKVAAADDDDDAPVVRKKPAAAVAAAADDADEGAAVTRRVVKKPVKDDDDDDDGLTRRRTTAAPRTSVAARRADDDDRPAEGAAAAAGGAAAATAEQQTDLIDYDMMTFDGFKQLLSKFSKVERMEFKAHQKEIAASRKEEPVERFFEVDATKGHDPSSQGYHYSSMLSRVTSEITSNNPSLSKGGKKKEIPMPIIERAGAKLTSLSNLKEIAEALNRPLKELKDFIDKQLSTVSSVDGNDAVIFKMQSMKNLQVEQLISKYIEDYVVCTECRGLETELGRDPTLRLLKLSCRVCGASRNLESVGGAQFKAQTARRAAQRNKQL